jgi:hypothetical protein
MALSDNVIRDGDQAFLGFASRLNPLTLPAGMLQDSVNMRLDRGVAQTRKGSKRVTDTLGTTNAPLTLAFILNAGSPPIVQDVYTGGLFAGGTFASQNYDNATEYIALVGRSEAYLWADGEAVVTKTFPTSPDEIVEETDTVSVVQAFDRLYVLRYADETVSGWEEQLTTASGITVSSTTATVNVTAHGYSAGMRVRIEDSTTAAFDGHEYDIQSAATDTFTITVPTGTATHAAAGIRVRRVKAPLYWDGGSGNFQRAAAGVPAEGVSYTKMPSTGWATYFNNRLWFASNRDTVKISDVLDPDLYDPFFNSFRAGAGGDDHIVAVHPWIDGQALVFCRKSIWLANLNQFASTDGSDFSVDTPVSGLTLLTNEIGCSARNTIATAGQFVFFLSDSGIYRLDSRLDLKLRGDTKPLSEPIDDIFSQINQDQVEDSAFAVWHNNRYLLAVPSVIEGDGGNRLLLAFSALNERWEYRDTFPAASAVNYIAVANYDSLRRVFAIPRTGNLYLLEENESGDDDNAAGAANATNPTTGRIVTRRFDLGDMHSKRFLRTIADVVLPAGATITTKINTINPDQAEVTVNTLTNSAEVAEDYNMKGSVRYRAHAAEVIYETSGGRPEIRSATIEASPKSLPATETRNAA